jgi:formate-dependent nitrite reductase membrane component NrfD
MLAPASEAPRSNGASAPPSYYGQPALKPSHYGWTVAIYVFVGGLAGGAQIIATVADFLNVPDAAGVVIGGRVIALAGAILGGLLLIAELHTKQRFFNMLRIFRPTSPMSIGTYVLISFGFWSLAALVCGFFGPHFLTLIFGALAGLAGWFMTTYTAALLAATSTPLWAAAPRCLAVRFASSAIATAAAALCIIALILRAPPSTALANIALVALVIELIASIITLVLYSANGVLGPLRKLPWGAVHLLGVQILGNAVPIALFILGDIGAGTGVLFLVASACALAGGLLMRGTLFFAGNESARRPQDYFRFAEQR